MTVNGTYVGDNTKKGGKKNSKEASNIFHIVMKASVKPATGKKQKKKVTPKPRNENFKITFLDGGNIGIGLVAMVGYRDVDMVEFNNTLTWSNTYIVS